MDFDHSFGGAAEWERNWEVPGSRFFSHSDRISTSAIQQIDQATASKQFFWFHYFDAHSPYGSTAGARVPTTSSKMYASLRSWDLGKRLPIGKPVSVPASVAGNIIRPTINA